MMTSSNGNIFRVTGHSCGEFTGPGEFTTQRPVTRSFDVFFDLRLNKQLNKQSWGWWFETLSRPLWRHRNVSKVFGPDPCMFMLQDIALEAAFPRSAICRLSDSAVKRNVWLMSWLESRCAYDGGRAWPFTAGSRAEGLALENRWGHPNADEDRMRLEGGLLGVFVPGGHGKRGQSCLTFRPEVCPAAYTKLEISDLDRLSEGWGLAHNCVYEAAGRKWLATYNAVRGMKGSDVSHDGQTIVGPATQYGLVETVFTLVCNAPHPQLKKYRHRPREHWPTKAMIHNILQLPMLLVLVGHKLSPEFRLQARISWSHCELALIHELSESVRQGYVACKYVLKRFLAVQRGQNEADDGRSRVGSYHIKTVFMHFLEKTPPSLITSPFGLFLDLLNELDDYLKVGELPNYFLSQCNLLETVGDDERRFARCAIRDILSNPLSALLTSPTFPWQVYGKVRPDDLVAAFHQVSAHPTCEQGRNDLSELLARVDEWRRLRYKEQCEMDNRFPQISGRTAPPVLVNMLKQFKYI